MKRLIYSIITLWICLTGNAQQADYTPASIADTLKKDAYSIVHEYQAQITIHSKEEGEATFRKVITIMDKEGKNDADFVCFTDKFRSFDSFKGELQDASGKRIMTIKKGDLKSSNLSSDLATDDKTYFYDCPYEIYPYTVIYEWKMKYKYGFLAFPSFIPVESFNQSLVSAQYTLSVPTDMQIDYKMIHTPKPTISQGEKSTTYQWKWKSFYALEKETLGPSLLQLIPYLHIKPMAFSYDKYEGKQSSWQELSAWHHSLLEGRDMLSEEQVKEIRTLVDGLDNDYDKVKKLYTHLGEKMRYVSIQLGIGGLQPMTVAETAQMGFGDCKALSYYLKAMLKAIGIPSEYVVISTTNSKLYPDYPNVQQMNHVILKVPLKERTLWIECTNPFMPFGYIHESIAGHDALIIRSANGCVERLPAYEDSLHTQSHHIKVDLTDTPQTSITVKRVSSLSQYEANLSMLRKKADERKDHLRRRIKLNRATIGEVEVTEKADSLPTLTEQYTLQAMYGNKNGNRLFIPINPFREEPFQLPKKPKKYDIYINYGYLDNDTINIQIPENYQVENIPKDINLTFPFGHIQSKIEMKENEMIVTQSLFVKKGIYSISQIEEFKKFSESIKKAYNGKIILKKQ